MYRSTASLLRCPAAAPGPKKVCQGELKLHASAEARENEVVSGRLECASCQRVYPILGGVAVVVRDVRDYLIGHAKGISGLVADAEIPAEYRDDFTEAKEEALAMAAEHIEEDLEAERVNALYFMNHYLTVIGAPDRWWAPLTEEGSPLIDELVRRHWDSGPFSVIREWREKSRTPTGNPECWVELGCGVGGLARVLAAPDLNYLGVDSSFASIALARHLLRGAAYRGEVQIPEDLLSGGVSRKVELDALPGAIPESGFAGLDFIVGEAENAPVARNHWDVSVSLNMIDMLEKPEGLPQTQAALLRDGGSAIQSAPYIWHPEVAKKLRKRLPKETTSSGVARRLYESAGFQVTDERAHVPWLFFKHVRQLEIYSVHLLRAVKKS